MSILFFIWLCISSWSFDDWMPLFTFLVVADLIILLLRALSGAM